MDDVNNFLSKLLFFCIFLYKKNKKKIGYGITSGQDQLSPSSSPQKHKEDKHRSY